MMELISQLRELEEWKESSTAWRHGLEELRQMQQNLKASNQAVNSLTKDVNKYLRG